MGASGRKSAIVKVAITYEGDDAGVRQVWRVPAGDIVLAGQLRLSADGRWLVINGGVGVELIDTQAGKVVFRWNSQQEDPGRLLSVDPDAGNPGHDNGRVFGGGIIGDQFLLDRRFGSEATAACKPGPDQVDCYHRAMAKVQNFVDVFDLADISVDAMPKYRVQVFDSSDQCVPPFALYTLDLSDDRVRAVPRAPEAFP